MPYSHFIQAAFLIGLFSTIMPNIWCSDQLLPQNHINESIKEDGVSENSTNKTFSSEFQTTLRNIVNEKDVVTESSTFDHINQNNNFSNSKFETYSTTISNEDSTLSEEQKFTTDSNIHSMLKEKPTTDEVEPSLTDSSNVVGSNNVENNSESIEEEKYNFSEEFLIDPNSSSSNEIEAVTEKIHLITSVSDNQHLLTTKSYDKEFNKNDDGKTIDEDLNEFYKRTHRCLAESVEQIQWDIVESGQIAIKPCMKGYYGKAYRMCYHSGRWGQVDRLDCQIQLLEKVRKLILQNSKEEITDGLHHLSFDMLRVLQQYKILSISDVLEGLGTVSNVLMSTQIVNKMKIDFIKAWNYYQTVLKIIDIFIDAVDGKVEDQSIHQLVAHKISDVLKTMNNFGVCIIAKKHANYTGLHNYGITTFQTDIKLLKTKSEFIRDAKDWHQSGIGRVKEDLHKSIDFKSIGSLVHTVSWFGKKWGAQLKDQTFAVNSAIISVTTTLMPSRILKIRNELTFILYKESIEEGYMMKCGYLLNSTTVDVFTQRVISIWSTDDCHLKTLNKSAVTCNCESSDFGTPTAVLILQEQLQETEQTGRIANIVYLGCLISLSAVILTFLSHICIERTPLTGSVMIMLNLVISVATTQIIFMAGIQATTNQEVCESVAILLHYSYLVTSFWLFSHTLNMYMIEKNRKYYTVDNSSSDQQEVSRCYNNERNHPGHQYIRYYCILAWIFPITLIVLTYTLNAAGYETKKYCWLSIKKGMLLSYIVPISLLIVFNTAVVLLVMKSYLERRSMMQKSYIELYRKSLKGAVILLPMVAINWFIGVLSLEDSSTLIFDYIFTITNSLVGLLIYSFFSNGSRTESGGIYVKLRSILSRIRRKKSQDRLRLKKCSRDLAELPPKNDSQPLLDISIASLSTVTSPDGAASSSTISELCT